MALPPPPPPFTSPPLPTPSVVDGLAAPEADATTDGPSGVRRWIIAALTLAVAGAAAGGVWASTQSAVFEARARVSFIERVDIGAVDSERARILQIAQEDLNDAVAAAAPGANVSTEAPTGRNFIDIIVTAEQPDGLDAAAAEGAHSVIAAESQILIEQLEGDTNAALAASDGLEPKITELEDEMAVWLTDEAAAEIARSSDDSTTREQAIIDARNANDGYWKAARQRNSLVDQQNEFIRDAERSSAASLEAASLALTSESPATAGSTTSPLLGAAGGALLGLSLVILAAAALRPRRS